MGHTGLELLPDIATGELADWSVPEVIAGVFLSRATGTIALYQGSEESRLWFRYGVPCGTMLSSGSKTFGYFLIAEGLIDQHTLDTTLALATKQGRKHGEVLVEQGHLDQGRLETLIHRQHESNFITACLMREGRYELRGYERPPAWTQALSLDPFRIIVSALQDEGLADRRQRILDFLSLHRWRSSSECEDILQRLALGPSELALVEQLGAGNEVHQLDGGELSAEQVDATLSGIVLLGLMEISEPLQSGQAPANFKEELSTPSFSALPSPQNPELQPQEPVPPKPAAVSNTRLSPTINRGSRPFPSAGDEALLDMLASEGDEDFLVEEPADQAEDLSESSGQKGAESGPGGMNASAFVDEDPGLLDSALLKEEEIGLLLDTYSETESEAASLGAAAAGSGEGLGVAFPEEESPEKSGGLSSLDLFSEGSESFEQILAGIEELVADVEEPAALNAPLDLDLPSGAERSAPHSVGDEDLLAIMVAREGALPDAGFDEMIIDEPPLSQAGAKEERSWDGAIADLGGEDLSMVEFASNTADVQELSGSEFAFPSESELAIGPSAEPLEQGAALEPSSFGSESFSSEEASSEPFADLEPVSEVEDFGEGEPDEEGSALGLEALEHSPTPTGAIFLDLTGPLTLDSEDLQEGKGSKENPEKPAHSVGPGAAADFGGTSTSPSPSASSKSSNPRTAGNEERSGARDAAPARQASKTSTDRSSARQDSSDDERARLRRRMLQRAFVNVGSTPFSEREITRQHSARQAIREEPRERRGDHNPELEREVERRYSELKTASHYEVLGVNSDASTAQIKSAFFSLAKTFHPDKLSAAGQDHLLPKVRSIFPRIKEAYDVLLDPKQRASYRPGEKTKSRGLTSQHAKLSWQKALVLFRRRDLAGAEAELRRAVEIDPKPEYLAELAWVLSSNTSKRSESSKEIDELIKLALADNPQIERPWVVAGHLALREKNDGEAEKHFRRALEWNPKSIEAARELRLIESRKEPERKSGFFERLRRK